MSRLSAIGRALRWPIADRRRLRNLGIALIVFAAALFFTQWWDFTVPAPGHARYQAVFLAIDEWAQQHTADNAENCGIGADAEAKRDDDGHGQPFGA